MTKCNATQGHSNSCLCLSCSGYSRSVHLHPILEATQSGYDRVPEDLHLPAVKLLSFLQCHSTLQLSKRNNNSPECRDQWRNSRKLLCSRLERATILPQLHQHPAQIFQHLDHKYIRQSTEPDSLPLRPRRLLRKRHNNNSQNLKEEAAEERPYQERNNRVTQTSRPTNDTYAPLTANRE